MRSEATATAPGGTARRDAEATRERILDAALAEFAEGGFAGARIQSIALRAGVNVRMLYHYFGDKEELFRAILRRRLNERPVEPAERPGDLSTQMAAWFRQVLDNPDWVRLLQWEALEAPHGPVVEEPQRRLRWEAAVRHICTEQQAGRIDPELDADLMVVALLSLATFPVASAPLVRMVTGTNPTDSRFKRRYAAFLERLCAKLIREQARVATPC